MGRTRKEKGVSSKPKGNELRDQIVAMGGNEEDVNLLKDVGDVPQAGPSTEDLALSGDVSKFLKGLDLSSANPRDADEDEEAAPEPKRKKEKVKKIRKSEPVAAPEPVPEPELSKFEQRKLKERAGKQPKPEPAATPGPPMPTKITLNPKSTFIVQPIALWHTAAPKLGKVPSDVPILTAQKLAELTMRAASLHETDMRTFQTSSSSNSSASEASFLQKILGSGTLSDRLSALTLLVQSSPVHNTKALDTLKGMAERGKGKGGRDESLKALRCVADWWVGGGAPDRKLKYFRDQPLTHPGATDEHLLCWYFEDWLKKFFFSILQILETLSLDSLPYVRTQAVTLIFTLLKDKPEQEQNLLRLLVNKLGDTEKPLCSRASYHLLQLLQAHPSMKSIIVRETIGLVLRPPAPPPTALSSLPAPSGKHTRFGDDPKLNKSEPPKKLAGNAHARYYATITFNQIVLAPADKEVAVHLINLYFEIFKELLGEGSFDEPPAEDEPQEKDGDGEKKDNRDGPDKQGRLRDRVKKGIKPTIIKGAAGFGEVEDAQSRLISAILTGVNRALPFAKLGAEDAQLNKHIDTLFLITHKSTFNISLQSLVLIQQITASLTEENATAKSITDRYFRTLYSSLHDARLATSSKQAMYLNLLFKSLKADTNLERTKAIVRRFLQVLGTGGSGATEFISGGLYLLGELFATIPGLRDMLSSSDEASEEVYDPRKRDPQYAHASSSPLWELMPLLCHYHPAISLHAGQILAAQPITASADLSLNTLSHFLDRFVYKNAKKPKPKGASAMQPAASSAEVSGGVKLLKGEVAEAERVNEGSFLRRKVEDIPVDQMFYHQFFTRKSEREKARAKGTMSDDGESSGEEEVNPEPASDPDEEDNSDIEEDEIWKAMQATMPKMAGDQDQIVSDDDDDDLPSGLDDMSSDDDDDDEVDSDNDGQVKLDEGEDDEAALSLVEGSDNEDLIDMDDNVPDGLIEYDGPDQSDEEEEWGGITGDAAGASNKRKREKEEKASKRKKLRSLPTFASYEDYAKMIDEAPEEDI